MSRIDQETMPVPSAEDTLNVAIDLGAIEDVRPLRIWHLSDPHFASDSISSVENLVSFLPGLRSHANETWNAVPNLPTAEKDADLLIVSGDLSGFGTARSLQFAKDRIKELAGLIGLSDDHVIVVPGNHDRFRDHFIPLWKFRVPAFEKIFSEYMSPRVLLIRNQRVLVYPFDSTEVGFRLWPFFSSTGKITADQFNCFNKFFDQSGSVDVFIAVLHHHPLPVPNIKLEGLTVMKNGGAFMRHMQERAADLVLHGHMHHSYSCRISYKEDAQDTVIAAAGTACQVGSMTCSLSVLDLTPKRRTSIRVYRHSETGFSLDKNAARSFRLVW